MQLDRRCFPGTWNITTISACCELLDHLRVPVNSDERYERKGDVPYYGANGLLGWINGYIFDEELVLIAEDGGFFDEYYDRPIAYMVKGKSWVNNHAHVLRARSFTSNKWVFYNLVHRDIRHYIRGGTRSKLNQAELKAIELPLPPLPEQRRIAEILGTIDEAIQKTEALIAKLKAMKQGLLHDLLTRGLDKNGKLRDPQARPEQFKDSPLGRKIPLEWDSPSFDEIRHPEAPICYGIVQPGPYDEAGVPVVAIQNLNGDYLDLHRSSTTIEMNYVRSRVHGGDVLLSVKGSTGRVDVLPYWFKGNISRDLARIRVKDIASARYLKQMLSASFYQRYLENAVVGTTRAEISIGILRKLRLPLPTFREQQVIAEIAEGHDARIRAEEQYLEKLKLQKKGLMHDLLTGKVRVNTKEMAS